MICDDRAKVRIHPSRGIAEKAGLSIIRREKARNRRALLTLADLSVAFLYATARCAVTLRSARLGRAISATAAKWGGKANSTTIAAAARSLAIPEGAALGILRQNRLLRYERVFQIAAVNAGKDLSGPMMVEGLDHLDAALALGRGAVLWAAHFSHGSLITKMALDQAGHAVTHISRVEHGFSKSLLGIRYLNRWRQSAEAKFLKGRLVVQNLNPSVLLKARRLLKSNELVSITAGAWEGLTIARSRLFEGSLDISVGAPKLAFASGAQLLYVFTVWDGQAKTYRTKVVAPCFPGSASMTEVDFIEMAVEDFFGRHEVEIAQHPEQWDGWKYLNL